MIGVAAQDQENDCRPHQSSQIHALADSQFTLNRVSPLMAEWMVEDGINDTQLQITETAGRFMRHLVGSGREHVAQFRIFPFEARD